MSTAFVIFTGLGVHHGDVRQRAAAADVIGGLLGQRHAVDKGFQGLIEAAQALLNHAQQVQAARLGRLQPVPAAEDQGLAGQFAAVPVIPLVVRAAGQQHGRVGLGGPVLTLTRLGLKVGQLPAGRVRVAQDQALHVRQALGPRARSRRGQVVRPVGAPHRASLPAAV